MTSRVLAAILGLSIVATTAHILDCPWFRRHLQASWLGTHKYFRARVAPLTCVAVAIDEQSNYATVGCHPETRRLECARRGKSHDRESKPDLSEGAEAFIAA